MKYNKLFDRVKIIFLSSFSSYGSLLRNKIGYTPLTILRGIIEFFRSNSYFLLIPIIVLIPNSLIVDYEIFFIVIFFLVLLKFLIWLGLKAESGNNFNLNGKYIFLSIGILIIDYLIKRNDTVGIMSVIAIFMFAIGFIAGMKYKEND